MRRAWQPRVTPASRSNDHRRQHDMTPQLKTALDGLLQQTVSRHGGTPGIVAMATDRNGNFYEGAAGVPAARSGRADDDQFGVRDLLHHQGADRHLGDATRGGRKAFAGRRCRPLHAGDRRAASARRLRGRRPAKAARAEAPHHRQRPDAAHLGPVLRVLQRRRPEIPHRAQHPDRGIEQLRVRSGRCCCTIQAPRGPTA